MKPTRAAYAFYWSSKGCSTRGLQLGYNSCPSNIIGSLSFYILPWENVTACDLINFMNKRYTCYNFIEMIAYCQMLQTVTVN